LVEAFPSAPDRNQSRLAALIVGTVAEDREVRFAVKNDKLTMKTPS
jgi:hypothetical protein